jgi:hypothetical protein
MAERPVPRAEVIRLRDGLKRAAEALVFAENHASSGYVQGQIRAARQDAESEYDRGKHFYDGDD